MIMAAGGKSNTRRDRTRFSLMRAGLQLFSQRPVDAVPIDDIVAEADVAKGSFFNHFEDKQAFANAISMDIRRDIEARVAAANADVTDPVERLVGGMVVAVDFALTERERSIVMWRGVAMATARDHPLNSGLRNDLEAACAASSLRPEAEAAGLLLWLGACQMLMANTIERRFSRPQAAQRMRAMMLMALAGLGVDARRSARLARDSEIRLVALATEGRQ